MPLQPVTIMKCLMWSVQGIALLFPLLAQATETRVERDAAAVSQSPVQPAQDSVYQRYGGGMSGSLADIRDPRIARLSINDLLPAENETRSNIVRYPLVPVATAAAPLWTTSSAPPSPLLTYIGAVATSIAVGDPVVPAYPQQVVPQPGAFDSKTR